VLSFSYDTSQRLHNVSHICAVLEANAKPMRKAKIYTPPLANPRSNLDVVASISLHPLSDPMCKIWFESIQPL